MPVSALIYWSADAVAHGLPSSARIVDPAWLAGEVPEVDGGWSLICEFDPPPSVQGTPSLARVRFLVAEAPHAALTEGSELQLFERNSRKYARVVIIDAADTLVTDIT